MGEEQSRPIRESSRSRSPGRGRSRSPQPAMTLKQLRKTMEEQVHDIETRLKRVFDDIEEEMRLLRDENKELRRELSKLQMPVVSRGSPGRRGSRASRSASPHAVATPTRERRRSPSRSPERGERHSHHSPRLNSRERRRLHAEQHTKQLERHDERASRGEKGVATSELQGALERRKEQRRRESTEISSLGPRAAERRSNAQRRSEVWERREQRRSERRPGYNVNY